MTKLYDIGPFRLDPEAEVLTQAGTPLPLGPRAVAVFTALVERSREFVSKDRILAVAWPGVVVEEANLAVQISTIRRVLARVPGGERWIETLPRRGYRFLGPVTPVDSRSHVSDESSRSNLPKTSTSFIGRQREQAEIASLWLNTRLITIVGTGGIGKTRLALQVAANVLPDYPDGVWFVDLAPLQEAQQVVSAVAQVLNVGSDPRQPLVDTLCRQLRSRRLLLLFDNCEHLVEACAQFAAALLPRAPGVAILATSREPLQLASEQLYPLAPLSLPGPAPEPITLMEFEAVQLFYARARAIAPRFEPDDEGARSVAAICRRLDGIPLAIEMAAVRAPLLGAVALAAKLDESFRLLTLGRRDALPRQQTLRATLDWSYGLLAEPERVVFRRLGVCASGFTLEAAAAIAADDVIDGFEVVDLLSQLVGRSLVVANVDAAPGRYSYLGTTRAYAIETLAEAEQISVVARRHAQYFRDLFAPAADDRLRMSDAAWRASYLPELDNIRAALDWTFGASGDSAIGISLSGVSGAVWPESALLGEGRQRLEEALARAGSDTPEADWAHLWNAWGALCSHNNAAEAITAFERAATLYRRLGDGLGLARSLVSLGVNLAFMGRLEQAGSVLAEAFPVLERERLPKALARYFDAVGFLTTLSGDLASAQLHYEKALTLYRDARAEDDSLDTLGNLADVTWALGDLDAALAGCRATIAMLRKPQPAIRSTLGRNLMNLAGILTERGQLDEALAAAREGLPLLKEMDWAWSHLDHVALRAALAGKLTNAARLAGFADSANATKKTSRQPNEARARNNLHKLLREKFATEELARLLHEGATMSEEEACSRALEE